MGGRDGSAIKNGHCFSRSPRFIPQHLYQAVQLITTYNFSNSRFNTSELPAHTYMVDMQAYRHIYRKYDDDVSPCNSGCLGTSYVDQGGLEPTEIW